MDVERSDRLWNGVNTRIEFGKGSVPVSVAAKVYGKDPAWVRTGIVKGWLPIGIATRGYDILTDPSELNCHNGRANFYISPKKLYEETGFIWTGRENI